LNLKRMNELSWILLWDIVEKKGRNIKILSSTKLNELFFIMKNDDFIERFRRVKTNYKPPDSNRQVKFSKFIDNLINTIESEKLPKEDTKQLLQYIMWNGATMERMDSIENVINLLETEKLENKEEVIKRAKHVFEASYTTDNRSVYNKRSFRNDNHGDRRKKISGRERRRALYAELKRSGGN